MAFSPLSLLFALGVDILLLVGLYRQSRFLFVFWNAALPLIGALLFSSTASQHNDPTGYLCAICVGFCVLCNILVSVTLFSDTMEESAKQQD